VARATSLALRRERAQWLAFPPNVSPNLVSSAAANPTSRTSFYGGAGTGIRLMLEKQRSRGVFHARLRQVEGELFRAEYSGEINSDPSDTRGIPDYHVGTSVTDVKIRVEQMAVGLGYDWVA
jgi:hypothetical protein